MHLLTVPFVFFWGDDRGFLKVGIKTYLMALMWSLNLPIFFPVVTSIVCGLNRFYFIESNDCSGSSWARSFGACSEVIFGYIRWNSYLEKLMHVPFFGIFRLPSKIVHSSDRWTSPKTTRWRSTTTTQPPTTLGSRCTLFKTTCCPSSRGITLSTGGRLRTSPAFLACSSPALLGSWPALTCQVQ